MSPHWMVVAAQEAAAGPHAVTDGIALEWLTTMSGRRTRAATEKSDTDEPATPRRGRTRAADVSTPGGSETDVGTPIPGDLGKLKVKELQAKLIEMGLDSKGRKAELVARLQAALDAAAQADGNEADQELEAKPDEPEQGSEAKPEEEVPQLEVKAMSSLDERSHSPSRSPTRQPEADGQVSPRKSPSPKRSLEAPSRKSPSRSRSPARKREPSPSPAGALLASSPKRSPSPAEAPVSQPAPEPEPASEAMPVEKPEGPSLARSRSRSPRSRSRSPVVKITDTHRRSRSPSAERAKKHRRRDGDEESSASEEEARPRSPPGSPPAATFTIRIDNLVRPLRVDDVRALLEKFGTIVALSMDKKRTHALAKFESRSEAAAALRALQGTVFQPESNKTLAVTFTDAEPSADESTAMVIDNGGSAAPAASNAAIPPPATDTGALDTLFKKTKAMPPIFWLARSK
ncbi:SAP domain-containing protein [Plasmodiophora brassicae]|uniref:SAP domain-containing protein n=1 Tax=Plasmodiophora brassicae TaxID=37360 RepID=A0A0G4II98_PLABS|nr:hypothetical protein PBRA_003774 [Plasmodiophora brassicae]SPQ94292.1 unnamed protein product [Plasmodiophora brassicae]